MNPDDTVTSSYGVIMPGILYGTAWKKERTAGLVEQAISLGFRGIDTACQPKHYHEAGVGEGVAASLARGLSRGDLYLQTKFTPLDGQDPQRIPYDPQAGLSEQVAQSVQVSLKNLQTPYLDGLVLHSPLKQPKQFLEVWQAMEGIFHSGTVRQLGISNCYDLSCLEWLYSQAEIKPAVIQNRFCAETGYDREIRGFARQYNLVYQSFWTLTANPSLLNHDGVFSLAMKYRRSPAQILFRFLHQNGVIPLTGTTSAEHMQEDLAIFGFSLTAEECDAVEALIL